MPITVTTSPDAGPPVDLDPVGGLPYEEGRDSDDLFDNDNEDEFECGQAHSIVSETDSQSTSEDADDPGWVQDREEDVESVMVVSDSEDERVDFSYPQRGNEIPLPTQIQRN